jgi:hypothetical protein
MDCERICDPASMKDSNNYFQSESSHCPWKVVSGPRTCQPHPHQLDDSSGRVLRSIKRHSSSWI